MKLYQFMTERLKISNRKDTLVLLNPLSLKNPLGQVNEGQKTYKCNVCNKSFSLLNQLKCHIEVVHKGYKCNACEYIAGTTKSQNTL